MVAPLMSLELSQVAFARHIGMPVQRINEILCSKRGVALDTAWLFAQTLGTTLEFWINLQSTYDLARHPPTRQVQPIAAAA